MMIIVLYLTFGDKKKTIFWYQTYNFEYLYYIIIFVLVL